MLISAQIGVDDCVFAPADRASTKYSLNATAGAAGTGESGALNNLLDDAGEICMVAHKVAN